VNKAAAAQYLSDIFGTRQGYVAVAHKVPAADNKGDWKEAQFKWPAQKSQLLKWAEDHTGDNVFICPALRIDPHVRKKGDMQPTDWLWADVDWQTIPADRVPEVKRRINELGSKLVKSGSGDNVHVYVKLDRTVDRDEFAKLNTGLRDYLYADNKQADNSFLRLPGTSNWKTGNASAVRTTHRTEIAWGPDALLKKRAFRDAKVVVDGDGTDWKFVQVEGLAQRTVRALKRELEETQYSTRHSAVWAMTKELHRLGLDSDQVHSLMHMYPPGLSKAAEENGYDVHVDVDRSLARIRQVESAAPDLSRDDQDEVIEALSEPTDEDNAEADRAEIMALAQVIRKRRSADKLARELEAESLWVEPPPDVSWSLTDGLSNPPQPVPHLIQGLVGVRHNVLLTAQYKTGKTAFMMGTVASALCDGENFLDEFPVNAPGGVVVGHWNCEMDPHEMLDDYIRPVGIKKTDHLHVANLRGYQVNIMSPTGKRWAIEWLRSREIKVWTIDSFARLARMAGVSEKDNDEVMSLLMALDEIKIAAEVDVLFLIAHTGRMEHEEGKERARGATALDDWADARWIMVKVGDVRLLRVEGRGVALEESAMVFDKDTLRSVKGFGGRDAIKNDTGKDTVVKVVQQQPGIGKTALKAALRASSISSRAADDFIAEAIEGGFIEVRDDKTKPGKPLQGHYLVGSLQGTSSRHQATPADVDLRGVGRARRK
jgi:hypothetical protein